MNDNDIIYFDSVGVEHIPTEIRKIMRNKNILTNMYRINAYDLIICVYFCDGFVDLFANR